ncbi:MAG: DUF4105 domain-containing protein [Aureispira sp.]|nr:DUF4105 domain-containing protein [Aureispira sp.]
MKHLFIYTWLVLLVSFGSLHAQKKLSHLSKISLLTCGPGDDMYTSFGHSAIKVYDPIAQIDWVFNYGTFNFSTPNFYGKFIQGKLPYSLAINSAKDFNAMYKYDDRSVQEQELLLTLIQKQKLWAFLEENYKPENREYPYDFFYDNCATRIREALYAASDNQINTIDNPTIELITLRSLLYKYVGYHSWTGFGFGLILGLPADKDSDINSQMFLPDYLSSNLGKMTINGQKLLGPPKTLVGTQRVVSIPTLTLSSPLVVTSIFFLIVLLLSLFVEAPKLHNVIDILFLSLTGLVGALFLFMWVGTDHQSTYANLNMLWANPLNLIMVFMAVRNPLSNLAKNYWWFLLICNGLLLLSWPFFIQAMHLAVLPFVLTVIIRSLYRVKRLPRLVRAKKEMLTQ